MTCHSLSHNHWLTSSDRLPKTRAPTPTCIHCLAAHWKTELSTKLKTTMFSLNVDEATDGNMDRILNVLVHSFDEDTGAYGSIDCALLQRL